MRKRGVWWGAWLLVGILSAGAWAFDPVTPEELKPGFVYIGPVGDGGWTYMHEQGRLAIEQAVPGVKSSFVESVPEGPDSPELETFARNALLIRHVLRYMDFVMDVAKKFPTWSSHCSYKTLPTCTAQPGSTFPAWWRER